MSENKSRAWRVVDDVFEYTTKAGAAIRIDMDLPPAVAQKIGGGADMTEDEQFDVVKDWLDEGTVAAFDGMGLLERARFMKTFFSAFAEAAELPLGESLRSSDS